MLQNKLLAAPTGSKQVVILGGLATGKSVLAQRYASNQLRYVSNTFTREYHSTFGADLYVKPSNDGYYIIIQKYTLAKDMGLRRQ